MTTFIICLVLFLLFIISLIFSFALFSIKFEADRIHKCITSFDSYAALLEYHMSRAYDMIYKDRILVYSLESVRVSDDQFKEISKDFGKLVVRLLGPTITSELVYLYGTEEALLLNVVEYFNTRYENDQIQKAAAEKLTESDKGIFG